MPKIFIFITLLLSAFAAHGQLIPNKVTLKSGKSFSLNLPADFEIIPAAEGLKRVRFFAKAPDARIFVTDLYNLTDNARGAIYILGGWDERSGKFASVTPYMTGLRNPNSVQFYRDRDGQDWLYIVETDKLTRRKFTRGETAPTDTKPQTLATFPDYGLSYKYGGWHLTRTIAVSPAGKFYISVGSSCNSCVEKEQVRASVIEMNPEGSGQREFARGLRNAVGLRAIGNFVFATNQGSDHLGQNKPDETFYALKDGADYGWPYCHSSNGRVITDPKIKRRSGCSSVAAAYASFPSRSSALGFDYFDDAASDALLKNAFIVALHGSTNKDIGHGYKLVLMRKDEPLKDFLTGFLQRGIVRGRPCDVMKIGANAFLISDDHAGVIYLIRKKGVVTPIAGEQAPSPAEAAPESRAADQQPEKTCLAVVVFVVAVGIVGRFRS